jgi:hypothetical protein
LAPERYVAISVVSSWHPALCSGTDSIFIPGLSFPVVAVRFVIVDDGKEFRSGVVTPQEAMTYGSLVLKR